MKYVENEDALKKLQTKGIKILISVGGYKNSDVFPSVSKDEIKRQRFATSVTEFMTKYSFDGIDIDWEFKVCSDTTNYVDLVSATRNQNQGTLIGVTIFRRPERMACIEYETLNTLVDYYSLLSYQYSGSFSTLTGFNTPLHRPRREPCFLNIENSLIVLLRLGVPREKLMIGLAFYGQKFEGTEGINELFDKAEYIDFKDISNVGSAQHDPNAEAAYIQTGTTLITFDDVYSIGSKCDYIIGEGYTGAMIWELGGDNNGELLKKVKEKLKPT